VQNVVSYDVVIEVDNVDRQLKPGMTATAHIVLAERDDVMRVPESALRFTPTAVVAAEHADTNRRQHQAGVWVDRRSGGLTRIPVTLGVSGENYVEVTSGAFEPDDRVVIGRERAGGSAAAADGTHVPAQRR
jgi:HlyD family secretion protein